MQRNITIAIITGIVSGCLFRDPFFGTISGVFLGLFIGIPLCVIIYLALRVFKIKDNKKTSIISCLIIISTITYLAHSAFRPSPTKIFKDKIMNPIPKSVEILAGERVNWGMDFRDLLKFSIDPDGCKKIAEALKLEKASNPEHTKLGFRFTTSKGTGGFSIFYNLPWFDVKQIENPLIYFKENVKEEQSWHLIYDEKNKTAYFTYDKF